jgi:hypothetical protein
MYRIENTSEMGFHRIFNSTDGYVVEGSHSAIGTCALANSSQYTYISGFQTLLVTVPPTEFYSTQSTTSCEFYQ